MDENRHPTSGRGKSKGEKRLSCSPEHVMDLVRRAQSGDVAAEHELHRIFEPKLRAALAPHRGDTSVAEDLDGEGYLLLHDRITGYDVARGVSFFTFLDRTLPEGVWSYVRSERRDSRRCQASAGTRAFGVDPDGDVPSDPDEPFDAAIRRERGWLEQGSDVEGVVVLHRTLEEAVKTLPRRQQQVYRLLAANNSIKEIAAALGITGKNCYAVVQRLRASLRGALEKDS